MTLNYVLNYGLTFSYKEIADIANRVVDVSSSVPKYHVLFFLVLFCFSFFSFLRIFFLYFRTMTVFST